MPRFKVKLGWGRPPVWTGAPAGVTLAEGATFNWAPYASDLDLLPLTFSLPSAPSGYSITTGGLMTAGASTATIVVRVSDGQYSADHTVTVTVQAAEVLAWVIPDAPYALPNLQVGQGDQFDLSAFYTKPADTTVTLSLIGDTTSVASIDGTKLVRPSTIPAGSYSVTVLLSAVQPFGQVTGVTAVAIGATTVSLAWSAVVGATGYVVEQSTNGAAPWTQAATASTNNATVSGLSAQTTYYFRVYAFSATQTGAVSAVVSATTGAIQSGGNFAARASGPGVVWSHDFAYPGEFTQFRSIGGGYTTAFPQELIGYVEAGGGPDGDNCFVYTCLGATLTAPLVARAAGFVETITVDDCSDWPDPNGLVTSLGDPGIKALLRTPGSNGEYVRVLRKISNTQLEVMRHTGSGSVAQAFSAGAKIGWDCEGVWGRPMSALTAYNATTGTGNGKPSADPAASGTMTLRTWDGDYSNWYREGAGYFAHPDYEAKWPTWYGFSGWRDGHDYYVSWRMKMDASRFGPTNSARSSKLVWLGNLIGTTAKHELVLNVDRTRATADTTGKLFVYTGGSVSMLLDGPNQDSGSTASPQPGSQWELTCTNGTQSSTSVCYNIPTDEWVTFMAHITPGHHNQNDYGIGNNGPSPAGSILVDTSTFTPVESGLTLTFESNVVQDDTSVTFPGAGYVNPATTSGYFNGWSGYVKDSGGVRRGPFTVTSYTIVGGKARWVYTRSSSQTFPAIVNGAEVALDWDKVFEDAKYKDTGVELFVAIGGEWVPIISKSDFAMPYGGYNQTVGDFSINPPAFNEFKPTSFFNMSQAGQADPPGDTFKYRFAQIIFSKSTIPAP